MGLHASLILKPRVSCLGTTMIFNDIYLECFRYEV